MDSGIGRSSRARNDSGGQANGEIKPRDWLELSPATPCLDVAYRKLLPQRGWPDHACQLHAAVRRSIVPGSVAVVKTDRPAPAASPDRSGFEESAVDIVGALLADKVLAAPNKVSRMARSNSLLLGAAMLFAAAALTAALAGDAGEYTFTVLRNGDPVGQHRFDFDREGDRIEIREATEIQVSFLMIPVYSFEYQGRQLWKNGRAVRIDATTNNNGKKLDITVRANGDGYLRTVNGRVDRFDEPTAVLALWNKDTLKHRRLFSAVEDKTLDVSFQYLGQEKIPIAGKELEVEHYRMVGDEERDLWYDMAGRLAEVQLRRFGSDIEYLRDQLTPLRPEATCKAQC
jgi:hypothetical protein